MSNYLCRLRRSPNIVRELAGERLKMKRQKIVIDFSSPNIAKPFHIGNMRSTLIGMFIQRLHRSLDHEIVSINHLGDWGTQFAYLASGWPSTRPIASQWESMPDAERIRLFTDCYVNSNHRARENPQYRAEVRELFAKMEKDLSENRQSKELDLWRDIKDVSLKYLDVFYGRFNVDIDHCIGESEYVRETNILIDRLLAQGIVYKNTQGLCVMDEDGSGKYAILRKSDGSTVYLSREIACIMHRDRKFKADSYVYVVDRAQHRHFEQLKQILDRIGREDLAEKIQHISYGRVIGLSTRKGQTEAVEEIVAKGRQLALDYVSRSPTIKVTDPKERISVAENLAISTIIVSDLKRAKKSEYRFSFENAFAENQNNAVLLQERHSRLCSIESHNSKLLPAVEELTVDPDAENNPESRRLLHHLREFEGVLVSAFENNEPAHLTVYLMRLSNIAGSAASALQVRDQPEKIAIQRLLLLSAARHVLKEGMKLLGVDPLEKM
uniref:Probable arginine--tRNA ligase, mitochondrial n=2 Tax=Steinernema glaseri TaxID=37863 RepID=A0A1I7YNR4_9BILA